MKPVAIFRHTSTEGPGYFATFLDRRSIPHKLVAIDQGEPVPSDPSQFSGICLMGGTISVNDPLPWIDELCQLIRAAIANDIPVIGHCLGGQLISKALGGKVTRNPVKEIGWGAAFPKENSEAKRWLGDTVEEHKPLTVFHWHGETFSLPDGATHILSSQECANQMFVYGIHLAMQCHVEMTEEMIATWSKGWKKETEGLPALPPSVQTPDAIIGQMNVNIPVMRTLAERLYSQWTKALKRD